MKNVVLFIVFMFATSSFAGHHFESDLAKKYPQLDITDVYVFKSSQPNKTVFIMAFNPKSALNSLNNTSTQGIYRFCIGSNRNFTKGLSPTFTFKDQKIQFYLPENPDPAIDQTGDLIAEGPVNRVLELSNGIKIFTGTVLDLFQGNSSGIHEFKTNASKGIFDLNAFNVGEDGNVFKQLLSTVIVLEMPNELLPKDIYYYATSTVEIEPNHWHRVNRISHVLFPHLYLLDKSKMGTYMDSNHKIDEGVKSAIYDNVVHYASIAPYQNDSKAYATSLINRIYPDIIEYKIGTEAVYTVERINGRPLQADAMNVALALLVGSKDPIDDKVAIKLERFQNNFPYVVPIDQSYIDATDKSIKILVKQDDARLVKVDLTQETPQNKNNLAWYVFIGLGVIILVVWLLTKKK